MRSMLIKSLVVSACALSFVPCVAFADETAIPVMPATDVATPAVDAVKAVEPKAVDAKPMTTKEKKAKKKAKKEVKKETAPVSEPTDAAGTAKEATKIVDTNTPVIDTISD